MLVIQINLKKSIDTAFQLCYKGKTKEKKEVRKKKIKKIKKVVDTKLIKCYN